MLPHLKKMGIKHVYLIGLLRDLNEVNVTSYLFIFTAWSDTLHEISVSL